MEEITHEESTTDPVVAFVLHRCTMCGCVQSRPETKRTDIFHPQFLNGWFPDEHTHDQRP